MLLLLLWQPALSGGRVPAAHLGDGFVVALRSIARARQGSQ
jgi:hypothetical protein